MKKVYVFCLMLCLMFACSCGTVNGLEKNVSARESVAETIREPLEEIFADTSAEATQNIPDTQEETDLISPETEDETIAETMAETAEETRANPMPPLGYTAPEGWYAPEFETRTVEGGNYTLSYDVMGLKVTAVKRALKVSQTGYYRQREVDMIAFFQSEHGIEASGEVDLATWLELGLDENDWHTLGTYVTPVAIKREDTREKITQAFIDCAKSYIDVKTPFIVGASGKPGQGVDCSGLVLQCMYAIGIYPDGLDPVQHSTIEEYNSRLMWADPKLKQIDRGDILPGDLVFYTRPGSSSVCHVAICVNDEECIEALTQYVEVLPIDKDGYGYAIKGFKRIIA